MTALFPCPCCGRSITKQDAAGYRILGPDEVDQVTLEKAADAAEERAEWVPLKAGDMRDAIRSLATKGEGDE